MFRNTDVHVGRRLRHRRWMLGMAQRELAEAVGVNFQQIQKYESGANRICASRLWDIAMALGVPVAYFFEGLDGDQADIGNGLDERHLDKDAIDFIRTYYEVPAHMRSMLFELARTMCDENARAYKHLH